MHLIKMEMQNFRNYRSQAVSFHPRLNLVYGNNAQGKTNLLEAVYYILVARSFRARRETEIINWDSPFFFVRGELDAQGRSFLTEAGCHCSGRLQLKIDGIAVKKSDYLLRFPAVVFGPEDLLLVKEGPDRRRHFLNLVGSRLRPLYYNLYRDYHRIVQQRNQLLRCGEKGNEALSSWNELLIKHGSRVIRERVSLLAALKEECRIFFSFVSGANESMEMDYLCSFDYGGDPDQLEACFNRALMRKRQIEIKRGFTQVGPHLDDFRILINGREARRFASQGQQRTVALALKMAEISLFSKKGDCLPVVLLDDLLSELDLSRQELMLRYLWQKRSQAIITTAAPPNSIPLLSQDHFVFTVTEGRITRGYAG